MAQPIKKFKCGACEVSIFENENTSKDGKKVRTRKASFRKRYKDTGGEWKSTNSLDANDIPKAELVLKEAYKFLVLEKDGDETGHEGVTGDKAFI